jgi:UDP-N-acetylmuramate: L-alanyl-gamma-D-glutamyl-meso-diaminopimelate ligase
MNTPQNETEESMRRAPAPVNWSEVHKVHVMGVCGSAMGAMATMLRKRGHEVRGSDKGAYPPMSTTLRNEGIHIYEGYEASNLDWKPDVVVVGNVIRPAYEEAVALRQRNIPHCSLPQVLAALFIEDRTSVVITGTHGKTTTSSMAAWILHEADLDPGFMIGGVTGNFGANHRLGSNQVFVSEGDEYDTAYFDKGPKFLHYRPQVASINNIEFDHADIYADVDAVEAAFNRFAETVPASGRLLVPAHDERARRAAAHSPAPIWLTGIDEPADVQASALQSDDDGTHFLLTLPEGEKVPIALPLWGRHNVLNALVAAGLAYALGVSAQVIQAALGTIRLPAKRQQLRGVVRGVPVIDDFAHHPTAIRETIRSVRMRYPDRRILALFEVESNTSRRRVFQEGFTEALGAADHVYFCQPLEKTDNLAPDERLDLNELIESLQSKGTPTFLIPEIDVLTEAVVREARSDRDVILAMSGRDFHGIHAKILQALESPDK